MQRFFIRSCLKTETLEDNIKDFRLEDDFKFLYLIFEVSLTIFIIEDTEDTENSARLG